VNTSLKKRRKLLSPRPKDKALNRGRGDDGGRSAKGMTSRVQVLSSVQGGFLVE